VAQGVVGDDLGKSGQATEIFYYPRRLAAVQAAAAAGSVLSPASTTVLRGLGGLAGPVYEARSVINDGHDNEARSFMNDGHDN
jgi:hypothetical protein